MTSYQCLISENKNLFKALQTFAVTQLKKKFIILYFFK